MRLGYMIRCVLFIKKNLAITVSQFLDLYTNKIELN